MRDDEWEENDENRGGAGSSLADRWPGIRDEDVSLRAEPVPDQPFLFSHRPARRELPFRNGFLCVGGGLTRIGSTTAASENVATQVVDLPVIGITAPGTRRFQSWYRGPAGGGDLFSTSDAPSLTFVP